ncbi:hypothetical protein L6452_05726 [Arctium lappa]|uniref:Uncharacterized protein n=1 Tax=Arctium lappa TaxID=4217 RepID=A0ACB9EHX0_ARCLA|nr:hypothetical protein L6452_05726 [Arctium lappa]
MFKIVVGVLEGDWLVDEFDVPELFVFIVTARTVAPFPCPVASESEPRPPVLLLGVEVGEESKQENKEMCGLKLSPKHVDGFNCRTMLALCFVFIKDTLESSFSFLIFIQFN